MSPPSKRNREIAARRAEGATYKTIAAEFEMSVRRVRRITGAVARYDRGLAYLHADPLSLEGLDLTGRISPLVRKSLEAKGVWRLDGIAGLNLADLLEVPNMSRRSAAMLIDLCASLTACREKIRKQ
jgi:hypothetical protein